MEEFIRENYWLVLIAVLWVLPWKGVALWRAARNKDTWWFVALLIINTLGILDVIYIFIINVRHSNHKHIQK